MEEKKGFRKSIHVRRVTFPLSLETYLNDICVESDKSLIWLIRVNRKGCLIGENVALSKFLIIRKILGKHDQIIQSSK